MKTLPADHEVMHTLSFPPFSAAANDAVLSRHYGGIDFRSGEYAGLGPGRQVAQFVWGTTQSRAPAQRAGAVIVALRGRRHHA